MNIKILRANPAGNITVYVLDEVVPERRMAVAAAIMARTELGCEQVGFLCPPQQGGDGRLEMAGGEFCGNATCAFALFLARQKKNCRQVQVETSGCDHIVIVETNVQAGTARTEMPLPNWVREVMVDSVSGVLVHLGGIIHLVVEEVKPTEDFFHRAEQALFARLPNVDAYGVIYLKEGKMVPLVRVVAANTLVWEGSCGSGSLAAAIAQSRNWTDGVYSNAYVQPAGVVQATVKWERGAVTRTQIGSSITLGQPMELTLSLDSQ